MIYPILKSGAVLINGAGDDVPGFIPELESSYEVNIDETLEFDVTGVDVDGDSVTVYAPVIPDNASFDAVSGLGSATSTFSFTPSSDQGGETFTFSFYVSDGTNVVYSPVHIVVNDTNNAPEFSPALESSYDVDVGDELAFDVTAVDADEDDELILYATNKPTNSSFPGDTASETVTSEFTFTPSSSQEGNTYSVYFIVTDGTSTVRDTVRITVNESGGSDDESPVITGTASASVTEGEHLEFVIRATDPEGLYVSLTASSLPENATFTGASGYGTVSDTFYFDPDYDQGSVTYTVAFTATDAGGNSTQFVSSIWVEESLTGFLEVAEDQGALPGSLNRSLFVNLRNPRAIYAIQFDLVYDPEILSVIEAISDSARAYDFVLFQNLIEDGRYRVGILPMSLDTIASGTGSIMEFIVDVDENAPTGLSEVTFDSATIAIDSIGTSEALLFDAGGWTVDILGDANLDGYVSIGDCVAVLANLLGQLDMGIRAADAADFNRDGEVRIADLQGIIFDIFDLSVETIPLTSKVGTVEIVRDNINSGYQGELPLWLNLETEAAAVQFTINYDPSAVVINSITPGDMVSNLNLEYNDAEGQITGVIYTFSLTEFGPSTGELINLDVDFIGDDIDPTTAIRLTDFEIVTVDAYKLNVDIVGELPDQFTLYQNYPNPFNTQTMISFDMPQSATVNITVYNVLGQMVQTLYDGYLDAGTHQLIWDGTSLSGDNVTSGVYFYRIQAENFDKTKKMLLVK